MLKNYFLSESSGKIIHIGKGFIGLKGFKYLINCLKGRAEAGILETPKEPEGSDKKNLKVLFGFIKN